MQVLYRLRQGMNNLNAAVRPEDLEVAQRYLTPAEMDLFVAMEPADQTHTVGVLRSLLAYGIDDRALLKAGLLHDVGKSRRRLTVLHRTAAVLLRAIFGKIPSFLVWQGQDSFWAPFYVLENHPRLSACMLAKIGCDERIWRLAELHHTDPGLVGAVPDDEWVRWALQALRKADNEN